MSIWQLPDTSAEDDEEEECNDEEDGDGVEQGEEEVDMDSIISSTLAGPQIGKGVRRSARLQQSVEMAVDQQIARAMQNVEYGSM